MAKPKEFHPKLVPALDALIGDPDLLSPDEGTKKKSFPAKTV